VNVIFDNNNLKNIDLRLNSNLNFMFGIKCRLVWHKYYTPCIKSKNLSNKFDSNHTNMVMVPELYYLLKKTFVNQTYKKLKRLVPLVTAKIIIKL
jgi:hypothetical protein